MINRTASLTVDTVDEEMRRPVPAALYSFLCIQKGLSDDYLQLSLSKAENVMMGTVALVHVSRAVDWRARQPRARRILGKIGVTGVYVHIPGISWPISKIQKPACGAFQDESRELNLSS